MKDAEYDAIAKDYQQSKQLPFRIYAEAPTILKLLGDVSGAKILDLACGEGIYARKLKVLGARKIVAVDISSEMIALALEKEKCENFGIEYRVSDAEKMGKIDDFDVVLASYLLNYAQDKRQLKNFCQTIYDNLKNGGRVVGMNDNPANDLGHYPRFRSYGFTKSSKSPRQEGDTVTYTMYQASGASFQFDNFYLHPETYQTVFKEVGFRSFRWFTPCITEDGLKKMGASYWELFQQDPPVIGFEAQK